MPTFLVLLLLLSLVGPVATIAAVDKEARSYDSVEVGVWFNGIHTIDFLDGSFDAEFYLWWISQDPEFHPFEVFQVLNGRNWTTRAVNRRLLPDGSYHTSGIVSVTVNHDWELFYYPFDYHRLRIVIETPFTASELRLIPNQKDSVLSEFLDVEGFHVVGLKLQERVQEYKTSFGFRETAGKRFSRFVIEIELKRESRRIVVAVLIGFIVANLIALLTFAIDVSMLGIRATLVASTVFAAIGNMYLLNTALHPAVGSLLADRFALGTFSVILIALLTGIFVDRLVIWNRVDLARKVNWSVFALMVLGSIIYYGLAFQTATHGAAQ